MWNWSVGLIKSAASAAASVPSAVGLPIPSVSLPRVLKPQNNQAGGGGHSAGADGSANNGSLDLVNAFDHRWKEIYKNGEALATAASAEDQKFERVKNRCQEELKNWNTLQNELKSMPSLIGEIVSLRAELEEVCGRIESLDAALEYHIDVNAAWDLDTWKMGTELAVQRHEQKKKKELTELERALQYKRAKAREEEQMRLRRSQPLPSKTTTGVANSKPKAAAPAVSNNNNNNNAAVKVAANNNNNNKNQPAKPVVTEENELELDPDLLDALEELEGGAAEEKSSDAVEAKEEKEEEKKEEKEEEKKEEEEAAAPAEEKKEEGGEGEEKPAAEAEEKVAAE